MKNRLVKIVIAAIIVIVVSVGGFAVYGNYKIGQIPGMTFEDMLAYTTGDNDDAVITVGTVKDGEVSYAVYGKDGAILPQAEHTYEIGSISKTFTAALLFKAIEEGKLGLDDTVNEYLSLPRKDYYPTLKRLVTHTSGYNGWYFESPMALNSIIGRNSYYGISEEQLIARIGKINLRDKDYGFEYSNFGISVVGAVLAEVYGADFTTLMNDFVKEDLSLENTRLSDGEGDLENYWDWKDDDAYLPAGALVSNISDMLKYARIQLSGSPRYISETHKTYAVINATSDANAKMSIRTDSAGAAWMLDTENNIVWHNGGTEDFNSYMGFVPDKRTAVVILSNLPPDYRIPATVMGVKLLKEI